MRKMLLVVAMIGVSGCATNYENTAECARTAGCTSSFPSSGYGPIQAQAAEPVAPSRWQPQP